MLIVNVTQWYHISQQNTRVKDMEGTIYFHRLLDVLDPPLEGANLFEAQT